MPYEPTTKCPHCGRTFPSPAHQKAGRIGRRRITPEQQGMMQKAKVAKKHKQLDARRCAELGQPIIERRK